MNPAAFEAAEKHNSVLKMFVDAMLRNKAKS